VTLATAFIAAVSPFDRNHRRKSAAIFGILKYA
jgi:hypothetical protein